MPNKDYFSITDFHYSGKDVLVLVNFDVPLSQGKIQDDEKIKSHIPTLQYLAKQKAKRILMISHLGRPKGKEVPELSTKPIAVYLSTLLKKPVLFVANVGDIIPDAQFVLLENIRFNKEEESENEAERNALAKRIIAMLNDPVFINDGFATNHREYSSVVGFPKLVPSATGLLLEKELNSLAPFISPDQQSVAILGGAKIEDKIDLIVGLTKKYDYVVIGGGMAFTFLKALGHPIGQSIVNNEKIPEVRKLLRDDDLRGKIVLPEKIVVATIMNKTKKIPEISLEEFRAIAAVDKDKIPANATGLDVLFGPTVFEIIKKAKYIYWNGPLGVFEIPRFREGTQQIGQLIEHNKGTKIAGGGDTLAAVKLLKLNIPQSTGGGASSELILYGTLPGIEALKKNYQRFKQHYSTNLRTR